MSEEKVLAECNFMLPLHWAIKPSMWGLIAAGLLAMLMNPDLDTWIAYVFILTTGFWFWMFTGAYTGMCNYYNHIQISGLLKELEKEGTFDDESCLNKCEKENPDDRQKDQ